MPISLRILHAGLILMMLTHQCFFAMVSAVESPQPIHSEQDLMTLADLAKNTPSPLMETPNERINNILRLHREYQKNIFGSSDTGVIANNSNNNQALEFIEKNTTPIDTSPLFSGKKSNRIIVTSKRKKEQKIPGTKGIIAVQFDSGTNIRTAKGDIIDPSQIGVSEASGSIQNKANTYYENRKKQKRTKKNTPDTHPDVFEFGIPGTHLIFSKPVAITIKTPNYSDGVTVDIATLHAGDASFHTTGLSTDPKTTCRIDGSATKPGSTGVVKGGQVIFYTCGASSFTVNPVGGATNSGDLKLIIGDWGQAQVYYNGLEQVYGGAPSITGEGGSSLWPILNVGTTSIGNSTGIPWTTATSSGTQSGSTYTAVTNLSYTDPSTGLKYTIVIDWSYISPNGYITWKYTLNIPTGNTQYIKFYFGMDSYVAGNDTDDIGYYTLSPTKTVGVYDNVAKVLSTQRYISGRAWSGYMVGDLGTVYSLVTSNGTLTNTITTTAGDLGYAINWNFGIAAGTYTSTTEWRIAPYVATSIVDLIPSIGQPSPDIALGVTSMLPISITNVGKIASSGIHTVVVTIPTGLFGPSSAFINNGWSCGAQVSRTITCKKTTAIQPLMNDTLQIPVQDILSLRGLSPIFSINLSGGGDGNTTNNTASMTVQIPLGDIDAPSINANYTSGALLPMGNLSYSVSYTDTGGINTGSLNKKIYKWNSATLTWGTTDMSPTYSSDWTNITTTGALFQVAGLPYGKYRFDTSIADTNGNTATLSTTIYIDSISWSISSPEYNMGNISPNTLTYSTGELIVTVRTVGAGYTIKTVTSPRGTMSAQNRDLATRENLNSWNGSLGYGVSLWDGIAYNPTIYSTSNLTIANQAASINTNGDLNTYTYRIRGGVLVDISQGAGDYLTSLGFQLVVNY